VSVLGERPPSTAAAERGTRVHEQLEQWLMNGVAPTDGTARAMMRALPKGGTVSPDLVEQSFDLTPEGWVARVRGRIDLIDPSTNQIIDHKTTGSFKYMKTEEDLATDTQAVIYSAVALQGALGHEFSEPLRFTLNYGTTKGATRTAIVSRTFTRAQLEAPLASIGEEVKLQKSTSEALKWSEVEPNYQSCDKYGRCAFADDCSAHQRALIQIDEPSQATVNNFIDSLKGGLGPTNQIMIEDRPEITIESDLDPEGRSYLNANPPDGLPDRAPLPEDQQPARRLPRFRWNDKSLSQMKAPDLVQAVQELTAIMSPQAREVYERHTQHIKKETMKTNKERLEVIHKINYGVLAVNDPTKERDTVSQDDFFAAFNAQNHAPKEQAPGPPPETPLNAPEPVKEPAPLPTPQKSAEEWLKGEPEPPQEESHPFTGQYDVKEAPTMLLVDAIATGGESVDLLSELAPWIADIEEKHSRPMCMIAYDGGWKHLGARLASQKTWLFSKNIVTIDSSHPLYRHCSHVLVSLADVTIKATR
tara:strand:+ start:18525 stop:20120 length:1596 start_codon:yes stop_codon:yes gene_type:complete